MPPKGINPKVAAALEKKAAVQAMKDAAKQAVKDSEVDREWVFFKLKFKKKGAKDDSKKQKEDDKKVEFKFKILFNSLARSFT